MTSKITLDKDTFKALAADTRIEILKRLSEHKLTLTDLSQGMRMRPSTIKEHLERLVGAGLIEQIESETKWKYYRLTPKGENILSPYETKVWILLSTSALTLLGAGMGLASKISSIVSTRKIPPHPRLNDFDQAAASGLSERVPLSEAAEKAIEDGVSMMSESSLERASNATFEATARFSKTLPGSQEILDEVSTTTLESAKDLASIEASSLFELFDPALVFFGSLMVLSCFGIIYSISRILSIRGGSRLPVKD